MQQPGELHATCLCGSRCLAKLRLPINTHGLARASAHALPRDTWSPAAGSFTCTIACSHPGVGRLVTHPGVMATLSGGRYLSSVRWKHVFWKDVGDVQPPNISYLFHLFVLCASMFSCPVVSIECFLVVPGLLAVYASRCYFNCFQGCLLFLLMPTQIGKVPDGYLADFVGNLSKQQETTDNLGNKY